MKSPITTFTFIILFILFIITPIGAQETSGIYDKVNIVYDVTFSNNATNSWYAYSSNISTLYHIENGTQFNLTIADINDPQSILDLSIGNATFLGFPDWEGEEALTLGYYKVPASFGFIANTSWTITKNAMEKVEFESFNYTSPQSRYLGGVVDSVIFEFRDIFQTSRLVYEQSTGLLLEATTKVFGFELSFQINSIKGDQEYYKLEESSKSTEETIIFSPILITAALALISVKKKY